MRTLAIKKDLSTNEYKALLVCLAKIATSFTFVIRPEIKSGPRIKSLIERLNDFLIAEQEVDQWPGTQLFGRTAKLFKFKLTEQSKEILLVSSKGLFDWIQPELPEDLSFLYQDDQNCLTNIAHEKDAWLSLNSDEYNLVLKEFSELIIRNN